MAPDCMGVQEVKAQMPDIDAGGFAQLASLQGRFALASVKRGYSGVGLYSRHAPTQVIVGCGLPEFDAEGRYVELRFDGQGRRFSIISAYFPSGSSGDERQAAKMRFLAQFTDVLARLRADEGREFILCGDLNIAHQKIDLKNWRSNQTRSGFLPEERQWLTDTLERFNLVDVYRRLHPDAMGDAYTWWSNRGRAWENNTGWRIDYHLATPAIAETARRAEVYRGQRFSDHAPLTIDYDLDLPS